MTAETMGIVFACIAAAVIVGLFVLVIVLAHANVQLLASRGCRSCPHCRASRRGDHR